MDFYTITTDIRETGKYSKVVTIKPSFRYINIKDIVIKGNEVIAFWYNNFWHNNINELFQIIDRDVYTRYEEEKEKYINTNTTFVLKTMNNDDSGMMTRFVNYLKQSIPSDVVFNKKIFFSDDVVEREDYTTFKLPYSPTPGPCPNFDKLINTLYAPEERDKIMWFIGALMSNSMKNIHKFLYLYGGGGKGKGTIIRLFQQLLAEEFYSSIDLKLLTSQDTFATSQVKEVPLLIDFDCKINDMKVDIHLLKLTAHETITVNKKHKTPYDTIFNGLLLTASNQRYAVRNLDAGINRRAIVVEPSGNKLPYYEYHESVEGMKFEIPQIVYKCIQHFHSCGAAYYEDYIATTMIRSKIGVFDFLKEHEDKLRDPMPISQLTEAYKLYLQDNGYETKGYRKILENELVPTFYKELVPHKRIDGVLLRNVLIGLNIEALYPDKKWKNNRKEEYNKESWLELKSTNSIFDKTHSSYIAQYATNDEIPMNKWDGVTTCLSDIDTSILHYVKPVKNHIVIDFDLKDKDGNKSFELNKQSASKFPPTYAEISKGGNGIHLHYYYKGDVNQLCRLYEKDIEIKVFTGNSSLRRRLSFCNEIPISEISSGLPIKEDNLLNEKIEEIVWTEKKIRTSITKNLNKEYHSATKPSIDFIYDILERAYKGELKYDVSDMKQDVLYFALHSTNNKEYCLNKVTQMKFTNMEELATETLGTNQIVPDEELTFYDIEVFPNVFFVVFCDWYGNLTKWTNPSPDQIEMLLEKHLVGFNNREYDNHILYGRLLGKTPEELYIQSKGIIDDKSKKSKWKYYAANEISYLDIYEMSSDKKSLKKWEIELDIKHDEFEEPWDRPLDISKWERALEYCANDVLATRHLFKHLKADYMARIIISKLSGLPVNCKTQDHARQFIFEGDKNAKDKFIYTDLSTIFPGYKYEYGKSTYRDESPSEGGYVYSEPGIYTNIGLFDVASMHPTSLIAMNYFGPYTRRYEEIKLARLAIKHKDINLAESYFNGMLKPFLVEDQLKNLSQALKIIINIVYGLTSSPYPTPFKHDLNNDNIVAKRGALFMIDLKHALMERGEKVIHIKTDSVKVEKFTEDTWGFIQEFGHKYGYDFEHEAVYTKMVLLDKATYIAKDTNGKWHATGARFKQPYVFKTLFSGEPVLTKDFGLIKQAKRPIYLGDKFIGKAAHVYASISGQEMLTKDELDKSAYVQGTKGYKFKLMSEFTDITDVDVDYYNDLVKDTLMKINKLGKAWDIVDHCPSIFSDLCQSF